MRARPLKLFVLTVALAAVFPAAASAHALLVRSQPADTTVLLQAPRELRFTFDEEISKEFSSAEVVDVRGRRVQAATARVGVGGDVLVISLPRLGAGAYAVTWHVLAEDDGHPTDGSMVFGIGAGTVLAPIAAKEPSTRSDEALVKWLGFSLLAGLVGGLAIVGLVLTHGNAGRTGNERVQAAWTVARRRALRLAAISACLSLALGFALLAIEVSSLGGVNGGGSTADSLTRLLADTRWGMFWLARQGLLVALIVTTALLVRAERRARPARGLALLPWVLAGLLAVALVAVQALSGHAAGLQRERGLALAADAVHVLAAAVWVGGLAVLLVGLLGTGPHVWRPVLAPFGRVAACSVGLVVATGLYSAGREVASVGALTGTFYGRTLLVKSALVAFVAGVGALNAMLVRPELARPLAFALRRPSGWAPLSIARLRTLLATEAAIGLAVLLAAGFLGAAPPGRSTAPRERTPAPTRLSRASGDLLVTLSVRPNRPGQNVFTVLAASSRRPAPGRISAASLSFTSSRVGEPQARAVLDSVGEGRFRLGGGYLVRSGEWRIAVTVHRAGLPARTAVFDWTVAGGAGVAGDGAAPGSLERPLTFAAALLLVILLTAVAWTALGRALPPQRGPARARPVDAAFDRQS